MATTTPDEADVDVHHPGHAVVIYFFGMLCLNFCFFYFITNNCYVCFFFFTYKDDYVAIVDKLDRLLNLRILIEGIEVYTVTEECLSITRSYIG